MAKDSKDKAPKKDDGKKHELDKMFGPQDGAKSKAFKNPGEKFGAEQSKSSGKDGSAADKMAKLRAMKKKK